MSYGKTVRKGGQMDRLVSKVSVKAQTVIPAPVRDILGIAPGDHVRYTLTPSGIMIDRAPTPISEDPFVAFHEWATPQEDEAWKDL
jgi:antitoxin PrlF